MNGSKVVVVTGASQGIGAAVVKAFRRLDYRIVAAPRSIEPSDDENILTIAGPIVFLDAAPFITGAILRVDGGQGAGH
jgi:NAD(P)-dependent dehydrogenase (short-subunit alcohol dehydrogenase family)